MSAPVVAEPQIPRVLAGENRRPAVAVGVRAVVPVVHIVPVVPAAYHIPRLPAGEILCRAIAVGERLLRADHHRLARPAIARGCKTCRVCNIACSSAVVYREDISGRHHKSLLVRKTAGVQRCDICDISIKTKAQLDTHLGGRRHRKAILDKAHCDKRAVTLALATYGSRGVRAYQFWQKVGERNVRFTEGVPLDLTVLFFLRSLSPFSLQPVKSPAASRGYLSKKFRVNVIMISYGANCHLTDS
jgi:hypothetical protein